MVFEYAVKFVEPITGLKVFQVPPNSSMTIPVEPITGLKDGQASADSYLASSVVEPITGLKELVNPKYIFNITNVEHNGIES
nr:hypothetical protein [Sulfuracidifex tepidarius]